jgi:hypothetical protein
MSPDEELIDRFFDEKITPEVYAYLVSIGMQAPQPTPWANVSFDVAYDNIEEW